MVKFAEGVSMRITIIRRRVFEGLISQDLLFREYRETPLISFASNSENLFSPDAHFNCDW